MNSNTTPAATPTSGAPPPKPTTQQNPPNDRIVPGQIVRYVLDNGEVVTFVAGGR